MPAVRRRFVAPVAVVAGLLVAVSGAFVAGRPDGDQVARNVRLVGEPVGGLSSEELRRRIDDLAARVAATPVVIDAAGRELRTTAGELGVSVDTEATAAAALGVGRSGFVGAQLVSWLGSFLGERSADVVLRVDDAAANATLRTLDSGPEARPQEPSFALQGDQLVAVDGRPGSTVDAAAVVDGLRRLTYTGQDRITLTVGRVPVPPTYTLADAQAVVDEAEQLIGGSLTVRVGSVDGILSPATLRSWLVPVRKDGALTIGIDPAKARPALEAAFAQAVTEPKDARLTVRDGRPVVIPGETGRRCCAPGAADTVLAAIRQGGPGPVMLPLVEVPPAVTAADLERLGVKEVVASFTTRHKCCEPRVKNIHKVADLLRGVLIKPGETFSMNEFLGPRTEAQGWVSAPTIQDGELTPDFGGGISQFMTTIFNAAFFAGLDFGQYQSHSIYISRYPYGREATINYPSPDLQIRNTTPYGVLVWPTYTDTSITVTLYGTKAYAKVEQTGQSEAVSGRSCTSVRTERTRTRFDGTTVVDAVRARYRAKEGLNCDQPLPPGVNYQMNPKGPGIPGVTTVPTTATTTTAVPTSVPATTVAGATTVPASGATTTGPAPGSTSPAGTSPGTGPATTAPATTAPATTAPATTAPTTAPPVTPAPPG